MYRRANWRLLLNKLLQLLLLSATKEDLLSKHKYKLVAEARDISLVA